MTFKPITFSITSNDMTKCPCCGQDITEELLVQEDIYKGIDELVDELNFDNISKSICMCKSCGFILDDIFVEKIDQIKPLVMSDAYKSYIIKEDMDDTYKKLRLYAYLYGIISEEDNYANFIAGVMFLKLYDLVELTNLQYEYEEDLEPDNILLFAMEYLNDYVMNQLKTGTIDEQMFGYASVILLDTYRRSRTDEKLF